MRRAMQHHLWQSARFRRGVSIQSITRIQLNPHTGLEIPGRSKSVQPWNLRKAIRDRFKRRLKRFVAASGRLRLLGVGSAKRYTRLPQIPTISESGVKGYEAEQWYGVVAPAGLAPAIADRLADKIKTIVAPPDVRERFYAHGVEPVYAAPAEFAGTIRQAVAKYATVIKALGLKGE